MGDRLLSGWGLTSPTRARVVGLDDRPMRSAGERGLLARGLGRAYNDAAQNAGGTVVSTCGHDRLIDADWDEGIVTVESGATIGQLIDLALPHGWFPPVVPGTAHVTVGGAIAADIHGKNHAAGTFGHHVRRLRIDVPAAGPVEIDAAHPWFAATVGGMGLTGVILEAAIELQPVAGPELRVETVRTRDVEETMTVLLDRDDWSYSVAWLDSFVSGRGVVSFGEHARGTRRLGSERALPQWVPPVLTTPAMRAANAVWYRLPRSNRASVEQFFFPLDGLAGWNRLYGRAGFVQYQLVVPYGAEDVVQRAATSIPSYLTVLKQFTRSGVGLLSFPQRGWTLTMDVPTTAPGLAEALDELDGEVAAMGGRVYLAKDGRVRPSTLRTMYPHLDEWRARRQEMDPEGVMQSDLARRLELS